MAGNAAQTSSARSAKINFLRPVASIACATRASSKAFTVERLIIWTPGRASTSSGIVGPHILSRAVVVTTIGSFSAFRGLCQRDDVMGELRDRVITHSGH